MIALYPGSFDPITKGHLDIIDRTSKIFEMLIVVVLHNPSKRPLFSLKEREDMIKEVTKEYDNIIVESYEGLLIEFAKLRKAKVIVKGLRAVADFENEFQMALMNKEMSNDIETMFLMTENRFSFISSSLVKEVARFDGNVKGFIPETIHDRFVSRVKEMKQ